MMMIGTLVMVSPTWFHAVLSKFTYAVQMLDPDNAEVLDDVDVVVTDCSMYGRKLKPYLPRNKSGMAHQAVARPMQTTHQPIRDHLRGDGSRVRRKSAGMMRARSVSAPFAPPMNRTATADRAAPRRGDPPRLARTKGIVAHAMRTPGAAKSVTVPASAVTVGQSAKAAPAANLDSNDPILSSSARRTMPQNATVTAIAIQARWTSQGGMART